jgi:hypothetical protein
MTSTSDKKDDAAVAPWAETTEACIAAANLYAETMQACWMAGAGAMMESLQSSLETLPQTDTSAASATSNTSKAPPAATSWYRPPVENAFLSMVDDAMKPWRTMMPNHSGHPQHLTERDLFTPQGAAEVLAAYHSGSGFSMAQISFPDEKSVCVTLPAPWAVLTK